MLLIVFYIDVEVMDLFALGPLPSSLKYILKINENVLWTLFTFYVTDRYLIPSSSGTENVHHSKRILSGCALKSIFEDFGLCPNICR